MKISDFIGEKATYESIGQTIWGHNKEEGMQMLADLRGWGAIQNLFTDKKGAFIENGLEKAEKFQDKLGQWIAEAINEKLKKERL